MTASEVLELRLDQIKPDEAQPRKQFTDEDLAGLADSIRRVGVITPIIVRPNGDGYLIVAGERRVRASRLADRKTIPAILQEGEDAVAAFATATVENVARLDLNPIEEGDAYITLVESHGGVEGVAALVGRPEGRIEDRIALAQLPPFARDAIVTGELPLHAARQLSIVHQQDGRISAALVAAAALGGYPWRQLEDPWRCLFMLDRIDPARIVEECSACEGTGETEEGEACPECNGECEIVRVNPEAEPLPEFFAVALGHSIGDGTLAQLPPEALERIGAARARAEAHHAAQEKKGGYYGRVPEPQLDSDELRDAAVATGCAVMFPGYGSRVLVNQAEFVAEYLPVAYEADVEAFVTQKRTTTTSKPKRSEASLSDEEKTQLEEQREQRAKEREKQAKERQSARAFNADLGVALARVGEVKVTAEVMRLLVGTIIDHTRQSDYNGRRGEGAAMWQRFTRTDWLARKNGDLILPRSAADRAEFAKTIDAETDRALKAAKTPEQALAVLVRYLGHQLADLRGLPHADLDGSLPYRAYGWRAWVVKLLPVGLRKRVPVDNGVKGSSYAWQ